MNKIDAHARIKELTIKLNELTELYDKGTPAVSDKEWDDMYFELQALENEWSFWCENSPCKRVNYTVVNELNKVKHNHPMLSLDKTKDIDEVKSFISNKDWIAMLKMDGLTCSLLYEDGRLVRAETRGDGEIGEDVTHNAMVIPSIPKKISYTERLVVDGEIICILDDFKKFEGEYKNARNFASGSIRLLDSNECSKRRLTFVAWDVIGKMTTPAGHPALLTNKLSALGNLGFHTVHFCCSHDPFETSLEEIISTLQQYKVEYPIDGIVFKYDNLKEYEAAGRTDHHFKGGLAYKFYDELYESKLTDIEWTLGKTGILTPTAIFEAVQIDGCDVSRASLHNISIIKKLGLTSNCTVQVSKRNEIIPQIEKCLQDGDSDIKIPKYCPVCGGETEVIKENESEVLICKNPNCSGKILCKLKFFVSKPAMNIDGLSEATLDLLINNGWVKSFKDIYHLAPYKDLWMACDGFGRRSVEKILDAIEESRRVKLENFITALSINGVGAVAAKTISNAFNGNFDELLKAFHNKYDWSNLEDIGEKTKESITKYFIHNEIEMVELAAEMTFIMPDKTEAKHNRLSGKKVCITGSFAQSRDILKSELELNGAKIISSVSKNLDILFAGDKAGSKLTKAKELGIKIMDEEELMKLLED